MRLIDVERFYDYWQDKLDKGFYGNINLCYDRYLNQINVYLLKISEYKNYEDYEYIGRVNFNGEFSGSQFAFEYQEENPETYDIWIDQILAIAIFNEYDEAENLKLLLDIYHEQNEDDNYFIYRNTYNFIAELFDIEDKNGKEEE